MIAVQKSMIIIFTISLLATSSQTKCSDNEFQPSFRLYCRVKDLGGPPHCMGGPPSPCSCRIMGLANPAMDHT